MKSINILMSVNKKFFTHIEELIISITQKSSEFINIYLMYIENELTDKDLDYIVKFVQKYGNGKVIPLKFDPRHLEGMPLTDDEGTYFGMEAYSRLFCAFKLPEEVKKILYLDADMICTGDISELYNIDFDNKTWIACKDVGIKEKDLKRLELPLDYEYINSGMLLINVEKLRKNYTEKDIVTMIRDNHEVLIYPDQDFINKMFKGEIKIISNKYNLVAKDIRYKDLKEKPLIIHYAGSYKPWDENVSRFEYEYIKPYYDAMELQGEYKKDKLEELIKKHKKLGYNEI